MSFEGGDFNDGDAERSAENSSGAVDGLAEAEAAEAAAASAEAARIEAEGDGQRSQAMKDEAAKKAAATEAAAGTVVETMAKEQFDAAGKDYGEKQQQQINDLTDELKALKEKMSELAGDRSKLVDPTTEEGKGLARTLWDWLTGKGKGGPPKDVSAALDAQNAAARIRLGKLIKSSCSSETADLLKQYNDKFGGVPFLDSFDEDSSTGELTPNEKGPMGKEAQQLREEIVEKVTKELRGSKSFRDSCEKTAAKSDKETGESTMDKALSLFKALLALGSVGFAGWFAYQYAKDNTGCFSYVGSIGAHKMGCSDDNKNSWAADNCNCGGGYKSDLVDNNAITGEAARADSSTAVSGLAPPTKCALGGPQAQALSGSYASCSSSVASAKSVLYAYKETSPLQGLAQLPNFLGKFGGDLLSNLGGGAGHILKMLLYAGIAIVGLIVLLMIIRFSWNYFKTHRNVGKTKEGGGKKSSGMRTRSRG